MTETTADTTSASISALGDQADAKFEAALNAEIAKVEPETPKEGSTPAVGTPAEPASVAGSTPAAEATPAVSETQDAPEYQNLLAKYGGDKNAAAKAFWETNNRAAQLAKEKEELAAQLQALQKPASPAVEAPKPADIPAELRRYDENMRAVENSFVATQQEKAQYVAESKRLDGVIASLDAELDSNDLTVDRDDLTKKLRTAMKERRAIAYHVATLDRDLKSYDEKWQDLKDRRAIREQILEQAKEIQAAREAKAKSDEEREILSFKLSWDGTIEKVAKDTSVIPAVLSQRFEKYVRAVGMAHVAAGNPVEDVEKFIRDAAADYMGGAKEFHQVQSAEYAKLKKDDAKVEAPEGDAALASATKRPRDSWTKEQWAAYEESISL